MIKSWCVSVGFAAVIVIGSAGCTSGGRPEPPNAGSSASATRAPAAEPGGAVTSGAPGSGTSADGTPRGLTAAQRKINRSDASSTAIAFAVRMEAWDTKLDTRPEHAAVRAAKYAAPTLRRELLAKMPSSSPPGVRWNRLLAHHGWVTVSTVLGGMGPPPVDTATAAVRGVTVTPVDHGAGHWTSWPDRTERMTYVIDLTRSHRGTDWSVSSYKIF